jgi:hypothetical protein
MVAKFQAVQEQLIMHFQSFLLILQLLVINVFGSPAKPSVSELFTSTNIPFQGPLDPTLYNLTKPLPSDLKTQRRAINLGYLLYCITFDGRNQGNPVPFVVSCLRHSPHNPRSSHICNNKWSQSLRHCDLHWRTCYQPRCRGPPLRF